ncbi:adenine deaminase C-terminal domain-containing protein [Parafrankia discariae]|uniref:adenine deaminase C-terminal domain-containing protein n=1 Tax=Parafrankia discariae TaxID=365528 RepID=UPI00036E65A6|nr:adenine deaminase C-terminal domain-containing protein [Parafrankia discariae]
MTAERDVDRTVDAVPSHAFPAAPVPVPPGLVAPGSLAPGVVVPAPLVPGAVPAGPLRSLPPLAASPVTRVPGRRRAASAPGGTGAARASRAARPGTVPTPLREPLTPTPAELERLRDIATGRAEADFAIRGGVVFVVQTGELVRRDILIAGRYIAAVTRPSATGARRSLDAAGRFVLPAYVDARASVERTLLGPGELARLVVPRGTVTVLTDLAEIEQIHGPRGRSLVLHTGTPLRVLPRGPAGLRDGLAVPSRPTAPHVGGAAHEAIWPDQAVVDAAGDAVVDVARVVPRQAGPLAGMPGPFGGSAGSAAFLPGAARLVGGPAGTEVPPVGGGLISDHLDDRVREEIRAGGAAVRVVREATLTPARAFGLDHVLGSIAPARLADLQIVQDLTARVPPDVVVAGGRIAAERGRALFDNLDPAPTWASSSVRLPTGLYTGSFTSPCMHWGGRRDTRLTIVDVRAPAVATSPAAPAGVSGVSASGVPASSVGLGPLGAGGEPPRVTVARVEPTLRDGVVVADPSRDLLKTAVLDRSGRADRVRVGMVRGLGLTRGALGATAGAAPGDMVIVGAGDADMLTAARALEGMGGGFVVVERGWVLAACPLPVAGLMSDAPWEAVLGQLAAVDTAARDLGCRLASPLRLIAQLGRELYVRP